jgi:hypothetical protein
MSAMKAKQPTGNGGRMQAWRFVTGGEVYCRTVRIFGTAGHSCDTFTGIGLRK